MSDATAGRRPRVVRPLLGAALLVAAAALISLGAFHLSRAPSSCGGDVGGACPDGFLLGVIGFFAGLLALAPLGIGLLAPAVRRAAPGGVALCLGAAAAGVYVAGYVAEPVTDGRVGYGVAAGVTGALALLPAWIALRPHGRGWHQRRRRAADELTRLRAEQQVGEVVGDIVTQALAGVGAGVASAGGTVRSTTVSTTVPPPAAAGAAGPGPAPSDRPSARSATHGGATEDDRSHAEGVVHLIELHRRGEIGDEDLVAGLRALLGAG